MDPNRFKNVSLCFIITIWIIKPLSIPQQTNFLSLDIVWFPRPQWVTTHVKVSISRSAYRKNSKKNFCSIGTWIWPSVDLTQGQTLVGSVSMDIDSKISRIEYLWYNKKTISGLKNIKYNKWCNIKYSITKYYWVIALYWSQTFLKMKVFEE